MWKGLGVAVALAVATIAVVWPSKSAHPPAPKYAPVDIPVHRSKEAVETLSAVIQCPTVGDRASPIHVSIPEPFLKLHSVLQSAYTELYKVLQVEVVNTYSLLYTWPGSDASLRPLMLISHMDVVPAPPVQWTVDPYSGLVDDEFVWGRGTLDTKGSGIAILEAMEALRASGWAPKRTIIFGFGHDEEMEGTYGAAHIAAVLEERYPGGLESILDEGGFVISDGLGKAVNGLLSEPVRMAMVGLAEKGKVSYDVTVHGAGGHSSLPPPKGTSTTAILGKLLTLVNTRQMPVRLQSPSTDFLRALAPLVRVKPLAWVLQNVDNAIINPILGQLLGLSGKVGFMVRTAHGVTGADAGGKARNALPTSGTVGVDFRTLFGDDELTKRFLEEIAGEIDLPAGTTVNVTQFHANVPASRVTPAGSPVYQAVERAILETVAAHNGGGPLAVLPYLMSASTDSKNFAKLAAGRTVRFEPFEVMNEDLERIHGVDERIAIATFLNGIKFYARFVQIMAGSDKTGAPLQGGQP